MYKQTRLKEDTHTKLKERCGGRSISEYIDYLLTLEDKPVQTSSDIETDDNIKWEEPEVPEEMRGLGADELPECCQRIFEDHTDVCEHWEKAWVKEFGQRVLGYRNRLTGRSAADPAYHKYV